MPDDHLKNGPITSGFTIPPEDPPGGGAMAFVSGSATLIGLILLLLGLLGDCLETLLSVLGGASIAVGVIGWLWSRADAARYRRKVARLRQELEQLGAGEAR